MPLELSKTPAALIEAAYGGIAFARQSIQSSLIQHGDGATAVPDKASFLQGTGDFRDRRSAQSQHLSKKAMGQHHYIAIGAIKCVQEPAAKALFG